MLSYHKEVPSVVSNINAIKSLSTWKESNDNKIPCQVQCLDGKENQKKKNRKMKDCAWMSTW